MPIIPIGRSLLETALAAVVFAFLASAVARAGSYTVTLIEPPGGLQFPGEMSGINDCGQVALYNGIPADEQVFIGTTSGSIPIPSPSGWTGTVGAAINGSGQVAGFGTNGAGQYQAFIGTTSGSMAIPLPNGWKYSEGYAVNDSGQVAGYGGVSSSVQAFIGSTSGSTAIPLPSGWNSAHAQAINASGQVAGYLQNATTTQAFVGTASGVTVIPLPSGWAISGVEAINDSGQVAGYVENLTEPYLTYGAFFGTASGVTLIPLPAGATNGGAVGLTDSGVVAGWSDAGGWIWDASNGTQSLNDLVPSGWYIDGAISISQNGRILAQATPSDAIGTVDYYVELDPTVPPTSAPLLTCGSAANGATYMTGGLVPGSWAQVKGSGLATVSNYTWQSSDFVGLGNNLPTNLQGTSVTVNGLPAALYYVDPAQVNFQVPAGVSGTASVQVTVNGAASNIITGAIADNSPGIFPVIVNEVNYAGGVFTDGKYIGDPSIGSAFRNAQPGDEIQLFATALTTSPAGVLVTQQSVNGVTVHVGTIAIPADFAGLVGVGEFQVNFTVPQQFASLPAGSYPITISVNGANSPMMIYSNPPGYVVIPIQP